MNLFFNKHRLFILAIVFYLFPHFVFGQVGTCSSIGYSIYTINGINTTDTEARDNKRALLKILPPTYTNEPLTVDFLYNPTHGPIIDGLDAKNQVYFDQESLDVDDSDFAQILTDASQKVTTQKLLLVGHSQGNFYANDFYDTVADESGGVPSMSLGVYAVATPSNHVAGGGLYLTSSTDKVISGIVANGLNAHILPPNVRINFNASDDDGLGHNFSKIYLAYGGDRIVSDIKTSLNKLIDNDVQNVSAPCIVPPKLTIAQKVQGALLAFADHPIDTTLAQADAIALAIANTAKNTANTIAFAFSSLAQSIFGNSNHLATSITSSVINADDQSLDTSQNPTPAPATSNKDISIKTQTTKTAEATPPPEVVAVQSDASEIVKQDTTTDQNTTTEEKIVTTDTSQNLYSDLLPGGGGVSATYVASSPSSPPPPPPPPTPDTTPPFIIVSGDLSMYITKGSTYTDAGATAQDNVDGAVAVNTTGAVDTNAIGTYTITYTASDNAGNVATASRSVKVSTYVYIPKYSFGTGNGDGRDWQVWTFAGSNIYDWSDTYVNNYLRQEFKIFNSFGGWCSQCLELGVFNHDPQKGFELSDLNSSGVNGNFQSRQNNKIYDVVLQWDATGYTYTSTDTDSSTIDETGYTSVNLDMSNDSWIGFDGGFNHFQTFPSGTWQDVIYSPAIPLTGGFSMILQPRPVYLP